jgi:hypothetical protein
MTKRISRTARGAFAALVAAGLTFGAGTVLATPDPRAACTYNPSSGQIGLACTTRSDCLQPCSDWYGDYNPGHCIGGCCICYV